MGGWFAMAAEIKATSTTFNDDKVLSNFFSCTFLKVKKGYVPDSDYNINSCFVSFQTPLGEWLLCPACYNEVVH